MPAGADVRMLTSEFIIKLDGVELDSATRTQVLDVTVEQDLAQPDMFAIRILDIRPHAEHSNQELFPLLDADRFPIGADIEISLGRESAAATVFCGEITTLEIDAAAPGQPTLIVRGYARSYRLHRSRRTRAFVNQKDSDIARKIAAEHGLSAEVTDTKLVQAHVLQDNQTDLEFLFGRARRIGFEVFVDDRRLHFRRPLATGATPELVFGETLTHVRLRMSTPHQVGQVQVHGWSPQRKEAIVGQADRVDGPSAQPDAIGEQGPATSTARIGSSNLVITGLNVSQQQEASELAQAALEKIAGGFIRIEATCLGEAGIRPGRSVILNGIGARFSGMYYATTVQHRFTADIGYMNTITIAGSQPTTLGALLGGRLGDGFGPTSHVTGNYPGVVVALVTNNRSPVGAMVKLKYPWLPEGPESGWARIASPMSGSDRGFYWLPEINDEVLVAFEHGDINRPYVIGAVWNGQDAPPATADEVVGPDGKVNKRIIKSRLGHRITIDDSADSPSISIVDKTGNNALKLDSKTNSLSVSVQGDINFAASNTISFTGGEIALASRRGVSLRAQTELRIRGGQTDVSGDTQLTLSSPTTNIEGQRDG